MIDADKIGKDLTMRICAAFFAALACRRRRTSAVRAERQYAVAARHSARLDQKTGKDNMIAPSAADITNGAATFRCNSSPRTKTHRFVVNLTSIRKIHGLVFQRRQNVLILHLSDQVRAAGGVRARQAHPDHRRVCRKRFQGPEQFGFGQYRGR